MQTTLHIFALAGELSGKIIGSKFVDTAFYKKEREAYLFFQTEETTLALGLAYHPIGFGAFLIPRSKIEIDTNEKPWPFFQPTYGKKVISVRQFDLDRILRLELGEQKQEYSIILEAIGPNGNLWLTDSHDVIVASLRHKKFEPGQKYVPPTPVERLNPFAIDDDTFGKAVENNHGHLVAAFLKKTISGIDETLAAEIMLRAELNHDALVDSLAGQNFSDLFRIIKEFASQFQSTESGFLYAEHLRAAAYPFKLKSLDEEPKKFKTLSLAIYNAVRLGRNVREEDDEREKIFNAVRRQVAKIEKKIKNIEDDSATADKYDEFRKKAELLKINLVHLKKGMEEVELENISEGGRLRIALSPALTPSENADEYFKKFRKAREGQELLGRRLEIARKELASARKMQDELEADFENAASKYESEIKEILPSQAKRPEAAPRLPYKIFTLSSGVTIYVGRGGEDNDRTTFGHAKPYELWFHAAQCPGSHVVLKFPDKNFEPSKQEINETAAIAAFHSKAKNAKAVPVIYTERRFVRKARGAKPGLVTVEREKMVMVEPREPKG